MLPTGWDVLELLLRPMDAKRLADRWASMSCVDRQGI